MNQLDYLSYDEIYLNKKPQFNDSFKMYLSTKIRKSFQTQGWPKDIEPKQLSQSFQAFELFFENSWSPSQCTDEELSEIEDCLSRLLKFLLLEKQYAHQFWKADPRRVQASTIHLYRLLQIFAEAIIPQANMNLYDCKAEKKLCIDLCSLKNVMNIILKSLKPIYNFLQSEIFHEQIHLTHNFVNNWVYFMKNLPKIKRNQISHIPDLLRYVVLTNKIFISEAQEHIPDIKKSTNEKKKILEFQLRDEQNKNRITDSQKKIFDSSQPQKRDNFTTQQKQKFEEIKFKFPEHISKSAIRFKHNTSYQLKKNDSWNCIDAPIFLKKHSVQFPSKTLNSAILGRFRKQTMTTAKKEKGPTVDSSKRKLSMISKRAIDEPDEERISIRTVKKENMKLLSPQKRKIQQKCVIKTDLQAEAKKLFQNERYKVSNIDTKSGAKINRGWQVIRDYVNKRIAKRKLQKLIGVSFEFSLEDMP